jgi:hypothetical protein
MGCMIKVCCTGKLWTISHKSKGVDLGYWENTEKSKKGKLLKIMCVSFLRAGNFTQDETLRQYTL